MSRDRWYYREHCRSIAISDGKLLRSSKGRVEGNEGGGYNHFKIYRSSSKPNSTQYVILTQSYPLRGGQGVSADRQCQWVSSGGGSGEMDCGGGVGVQWGVSSGGDVRVNGLEL